MTITEFREELDQRIENARKKYFLHRRHDMKDAKFWWDQRQTLRAVKELAMHLNGEI